MGDADDSYDFEHLERFVALLREGYDLVMGNRFAGGIKPGAMPWKNRYIGNPILTAIGRLFFKCPARDFHCGLRGFSADAFRQDGPANDRYGVRLGNGHQSHSGAHEDRRDGHHAEPGRSLAAASPSPVAGRLAPLAVHAAL